VETRDSGNYKINVHINIHILYTQRKHDYISGSV
jgi:hypothetical protein